jgi:hypothetical protein
VLGYHCTDRLGHANAGMEQAMENVCPRTFTDLKFLRGGGVMSWLLEPMASPQYQSS